MPSDNNEEVEFESPEETQPEPTGEERIRPGLLGLNWKILLWLAAVGLVPVLMMLPVLLPLVQDAPEIHQRIAAQADDLRQAAVDSQQALLDLKKQIADESLKKQLEAFEKSARRSFKDLGKKLSGLITTEKKPEEIAAYQSLKKAVESAAGPFSEVALVETAAKKVMFSKVTKPAGTLEKTFPVLHKTFAPDKPPAAQSIPGWHWAPVGSTPYALVVYTPELKAEALPQAAEAAAPAALETSELNEFDQRLSRWTWILAVALPLLAIVLLACAFLWLRAGLLAPLIRITKGARTLLESPGQLDEDQLARPGLLEDLAAALSRLAVRMQRLEEIDRQATIRQSQINAIEQTLSRAVAGQLGSRVPVEPGECETLALGINRLLESLAERSTAVVQAGSRLKSSADRLRDLSDQLGKTLVPVDDDRSPADPGPLGDILGAQLETLCQSTGEITEGLLKKSPRKWTPEDHEAMTGSMGSSRAGLRVLVQRAQEARTASQRLGALRQAAEVLSTNLAIASEAHSWRRIDELTDDARNLSKEITEISGSLGANLDNLARSGDEMKDTLQQATDLSLQCEKLVGSWESLRDDLERQRKDLLRQIETIRPGAGSLGSDLRDVFRLLDEYRKASSGRQKLLQGVSQSTSELSRTSAEVLSALEKLGVSGPAPAAVTRELAEKQQALEKAIQEISSLAAEEGIQALSEDARAIIDQIRTAADQAKKRVLGEPEADA
jgi:methyl-accepting chemotaxis protein